MGMNAHPNVELAGIEPSTGIGPSTGIEQGVGAEPILHAMNVTKSYGPQAANGGMTDLNTAAPVLRSVSFAMSAGESIAIMGPSGAGKSTLLHILAGILTPTSGHVIYRGRDLGKMSDAQRSKLRRTDFGFVFQSGQLLPELPALENAALPLMLARVDRQQALAQAQQWMNSLGLAGLQDHRPGQLSGGQQQRVAIARAMAIHPAIIFADEPTGALDQNTGHHVMQLMTSLSAHQHVSLIVVTHDPHVAAFCNRTVYMQDGQLFSSSPSSPDSPDSPIPPVSPVSPYVPASQGGLQ